MPDDPTTPLSNGAAPPTEEAPRKSLRDIAEDAYDEVLEASDEPEGAEPSAQDGRARDDRGRFVSKPGEAEGDQPTQPGDQQQPAPQPPDQPHPAPEGSSSEAPQNWKPEHRLMFSKLPADAQAFLTERLSEVEGGLQRKIQANVQAAEFVSSIAPVFNHPALAASLREAGFSPSQAVQDWASMHIRALSPNPQERMQLWMEMGQRMGLDPAALAPNRQGQNGQLSQADLKDPAIRYFADHLGKVLNDQQALRGQLQSMQQQDAQRQNAEAMKVTRWGIDSFAGEKDSQGKPLRPDFDLVLPEIIELFRANPDRDLREAYETARWMRADTRDKLLQQQRSSVEQKQSDQRARQAVRGNARGLTSPVSKPADPAGASSLRDVIENSADEVGF
jgi:hypothetical protein